MTRSNTDPVIRNHREQIAILDREIVAALNARIRLVRSLKDYKAAQGIDFYDAGQEERVILQLRQSNGGPMSDAGLHEVYTFILEWTKREAVGLGEAQAE